jgi:hypothetical protein
MEEYEYQNGPDVTDPYRPPVGATPSDDIELIIKRHYELPAVNRGVCLCEVGGRRGKPDAQEDPTCSVREALEGHY